MKVIVAESKTILRVRMEDGVIERDAEKRTILDDGNEIAKVMFEPLEKTLMKVEYVNNTEVVHRDFFDSDNREMVYRSALYVDIADDLFGYSLEKILIENISEFLTAVGKLIVELNKCPEAYFFVGINDPKNSDFKFIHCDNENAINLLKVLFKSRFRGTCVECYVHKPGKQKGESNTKIIIPELMVEPYMKNIGYRLDGFFKVTGIDDDAREVKLCIRGNELTKKHVAKFVCNEKQFRAFREARQQCRKIHVEMITKFDRLIFDYQLPDGFTLLHVGELGKNYDPDILLQ